jgi:NAD(P)-dependent dehydrogenase (short-subunit alcohol dehydrogenase family)
MPEPRSEPPSAASLLGYRPPADLLAQRSVLVAGAGGGLGRPLSLACARHGASVLLLDRRERDLEDLYDEIAAAGGPEPVIIATDLAALDDSGADLIAAQVGDTFGALHGLVFAAAAPSPLTPLEHCPARIWNDVLAVNLTATFLLIRALLPTLKNAPRSSIVLSSHAAARTGQAYWGPTAVAAGGLDALCGVWADELSANTRLHINALDPGPLRTESRLRQFPGLGPRHLRPVEEVVPAYLYLLGDDGAGISGRRLSIPDPGV